MNQPTILFYLANGLGNCILAIPAIKAVQMLGYAVDLAIPKDWNRSKPLIDLFRIQPFVNKIVLEAGEVSSERYEKIFIANTYEKTSLRAFLESLPQAVLIKHPNWLETSVHESEYMMTIPRSLGFYGPTPNLKIATKEPNSRPVHPYFAIAFSCLDGYPWSLKRWPLQHWIDLLKILNKNYPNLQFVLIGSAGDEDEAEAIQREVNVDTVISMCGKLTVPESAYILSNAKCLITVDNGISHLAAATNIQRIVALYGPTLLSKNVPLHENIQIIKSEVECSPCFGTKQFRICDNNQCLTSISPMKVYSCLNMV